MQKDESLLNRAIHETVEIVPYDSGWRGRFEEEKGRVERLFPGELVLEHIGSTAVVGMAAKPIVDCMAAVASMEVADDLVEWLCENGYVTSAAYNRELGDRRWLMRHADGRRTHHLHLVLVGSSHYVESLRFRDLLRGDEKLAREYEALKRKLAGEFGADREGYTKAKGEFIAGALWGEA